MERVVFIKNSLHSKMYLIFIIITFEFTRSRQISPSAMATPDFSPLIGCSKGGCLWVASDWSQRVQWAGLQLQARDTGFDFVDAVIC